MMTALVKLPSVSSTLPSCDMGNIRVIEQLATWLEPLGFSIHIQPIAGHKDKANLIATLGSGSGGLVLAGRARPPREPVRGWRSPVPPPVPRPACPV